MTTGGLGTTTKETHVSLRKGLAGKGTDNQVDGICLLTSYDEVASGIAQ